MTINVQANPHGETFFLNLRFLLIICVFVGNAIEPLIKDMAMMHNIYVWIFTFHMPLFVFVTGYFAKANLLGRSGHRLLLQIGLQYVIFQSLYSLLDVTIFQVQNIQHSFFIPYLLLWFLASHLCWRVILIAMNNWTPLQQLALSLALGVFVGYLQVDGAWLSLSRTFVYLPFFIAGYHFSFAYLEKIFTPKARLFTLALQIALLGAIAIWGSRIDAGWLYGSMTYGQLGYHEWHAGLVRLALYGLQLLAGIAFLSFVPMRESKLTDLGRRTLYVFLLHGFIIRIAAASPLYNYITNTTTSIMLMIGAVLLTLLLSHSFIRKWTSPVIEPSVQWLLNLERRAFRSFGTTNKH
ncbi:acyltransferase family protein [Paenibacillus lentus]|uniref:Fucose 4-O-acetylase n=1 Tax=Paenibacillus lentus TaxID=1338368 RepID=A0A3S8RTX9_9BACL|nr:fucose 4-O-acetylase [Paenibacillus lentus]AZK46585.1 fucose 4-O-acetylase [Paenibacillus lentus]